MVMISTRTFQARIQLGNWVMIFLLLVLTIYFMWEKHAIFFALSILLLLVIIERSIHTEYRLTKDTLTIHNGRLSKDRTIPVKDIKRVERLKKFRVGKKALITYLVIVYGDNKTVGIIPQSEDDFIKQLLKVKEQ